MWKACVAVYFMLGLASVGLSTLAATDAIDAASHPHARSLLSVGAAMAVALLGFLRPEARYKNVVRAWRELEVAKSRYQFAGGTRAQLIDALARSERLATDDEHRETPSAKTIVAVTSGPTG